VCWAYAVSACFQFATARIHKRDGGNPTFYDILADLLDIDKESYDSKEK
jgi:hypothetical protein